MQSNWLFVTMERTGCFGNSYSSKRRRIVTRVKDHLSTLDTDQLEACTAPYVDDESRDGSHNVSNQEKNDVNSQESQVTDVASDASVDVVYRPPSPSEMSLGLGVNDLENSQQLVGENVADMTPQVDERTISGNKDNETKLGEDPDNEESSCKYAEQLREWALKHGIPHMAISDLLQILAEVPVPGLPVSARTLLKTERSTAVQKKAGGDYYYFGISETLQAVAKAINCAEQGNTLSLQVNIDGLPLFKSSRTSLWPIIFTVKEWGKEVFMAAVYCGTEKPISLREFLGDFVAELKVLQESGITVSDKKFNVVLGSVVCDAPARAFMKCIKGHGGYHGCERCDQAGLYVQNRMTFPEMEASARSDTSFAQMQDEDHHSGESPFAELGIGMVSCFPLDYMHLVCLGVMRKLIALWLQGPLSCRIGWHDVARISARLVDLRQTVPQDFVRRPRSLEEFRMWKAVEFRQFLLYTGPVVLNGVLSKRHFFHFLVLSVAIRLLLDKDVTSEELSYAEKLLQLFVSEFSQIYGDESLVYNVHSLIHIVDDARKYGSLDDVSAFVFENFLKDLKGLVRKQHQILPQIVRRIMEMKQTRTFKIKEQITLCKGAHGDGPLPENGPQCCEQFSTIDGKWTLSRNERDCYVECNGEVCKIHNIIRNSSGDVYLVSEQMEKVDNVYDYPLSSSKIGIVVVKSVSKPVIVHSLQSVSRKLWMMPGVAGGSAVFPLVHRR